VRGLVASLLALGVGVASAPVECADEAEDQLPGFIAGDYVIIGKEPDGGEVYGASAQIELGEEGVMLKRRRGQREIVAAGRLEGASPPGEGRVLRFSWQDPDPVLMTCLVGWGLDNFARLSCVWFREGSQPKEPGLEAMFPTAAWPR
jgi:hypothetical protein